ncbi:unnamed protein product, partial [Meganyctiphanes norvegica]
FPDNKMDDELLSLKWNSQKNIFFEYLKILREKSTYSDATLTVEGKFYPVHKLVMSTYSEYFCNIFEKTPCKSPVIVLQDIQSHDLEALLDYMYLGEVIVDQNNLASLLKTAEFLSIKGLALPDKDSTNLPKNSTSSHKDAHQDSPPPKRRRHDSNSIPDHNAYTLLVPEKFATALANPTQTTSKIRLNFKIPAHSTSNNEQYELPDVKFELNDTQDVKVEIEEFPDLKVDIEDELRVLVHEIWDAEEPEEKFRRESSYKGGADCAQDPCGDYESHLSKTNSFENNANSDLELVPSEDYASDLSKTNNYGENEGSEQNTCRNYESDLSMTNSFEKNTSSDQDLGSHFESEVSKNMSYDEGVSSEQNPVGGYKSGIAIKNTLKYLKYCHVVPTHKYIETRRSEPKNCPICEKQFKVLRNIRRHILNKHSKFLLFRAKEEGIKTDALHTALAYTWVDIVHKDFALSSELIKKFRNEYGEGAQTKKGQQSIAIKLD